MSIKKKTEKNINILRDRFGTEKVWVNYNLTKVPGRNTTTKVPYSPITKRKASSTNQADWGTYEEAIASSPNIGIVFTPSCTLLGIDIDHCLDKGTHTINHPSAELIAQLIIEADTYTEISPSGTGLHLFLSLTSSLSLIANRHGNFEAYTEGRYFTTTNIPYKEAHKVRTVTPMEALQLLDIIGYPWGKAGDQKALMSITPSTSSGAHDLLTPSNLKSQNTDILLNKMFASKNGKSVRALYEGNATATTYKGDDSAADMALLSHLAFWTAKSPTLMESIWLASPLGAREKTQQRADYRTRSIAAAIANCTKVYEEKDSKLKQEIEENAPSLDLLYTTIRGDKVYTQNTENICRILRHHSLFKGHFRYDTFKNTLEIGEPNPKQIALIWRSLEDHDTIEIQTAISIIFSVFGKVGKEMVLDAIMKVSRENTIDSASDYIRALQWDNTPRLDEWLIRTYNTPDTAYYRTVAANWMKGLVRRIIEPGSKFDYVLVLEGEQGIKKSTSLSILGNVYPDQPNWHVETTMSTENKDFFMQFQGKAIIEFSEGETLSRTEIKKMKAIITTASDKYRPAYGRLSMDFPRRCVFAMTTNQTEYLKDETGNRRWLPVACDGQANIEWLKENRDQLFAEAYYRVITLKETTWEFPEEETFEMQSARRIHSPSQDVILDWYFNKLSLTDRENGVTSYQVFRDCLHAGFPGKSITRYEEMEIADVLNNFIRLKKVRRMNGGVQYWKWVMDVKSIQSAEPTPPTELEKFTNELKEEGQKEIPF